MSMGSCQRPSVSWRAEGAFLAIIRKNILRAVFPGRGLMARWHNGRGGVLSSSRSGGRGACGRRQPTIMDSPSFHSLSFLVDVFVFVIVFVSVLNFLLFFFTATGSKLDSPSFHSPICLVDVVVFVFVFVFDLSGFADDNRPSWIFTQLPCPRLQFVFARTPGIVWKK